MQNITSCAGPESGRQYAVSIPLRAGQDPVRVETGGHSYQFVFPPNVVVQWYSAPAAAAPVGGSQAVRTTQSVTRTHAPREHLFLGTHHATPASCAVPVQYSCFRALVPETQRRISNQQLSTNPEWRRLVFDRIADNEDVRKAQIDYVERSKRRAKQEREEGLRKISEIFEKMPLEERAEALSYDMARYPRENQFPRDGDKLTREKVDRLFKGEQSDEITNSNNYKRYAPYSVASRGVHADENNTQPSAPNVLQQQKTPLSDAKLSGPHVSQGTRAMGEAANGLGRSENQVSEETLTEEQLWTILAEGAIEEGGDATSPEAMVEILKSEWNGMKQNRRADDFDVNGPVE